MPRQSRVVGVGVPHHITQRGNNRQTIFRSDADRILYLATLRLKAREHGMSILGNCLLSNHVHLVSIPRHENSLSRALGQTHFIYAQRFSRGTHCSGHL
jgi:putative transposase